MRTAKDIKKIVKAGLMRDHLRQVADERKAREKSSREEEGRCHYCGLRSLLRFFHWMFSGEPVCDVCAAERRPA